MKHAVRISAVLVGLGVMLCGASWTQAAQAAKVDVTGNWALEVTTEAGGTTTPSVTLKQDGEKLTGHYSSATLGEADVSGTVKGREVIFAFSADAGGMAIEVTYTLTVDSKDSMTGRISLGGLGEGTVKAKRK
jgi:hypothetical protein